MNRMDMTPVLKELMVSWERWTDVLQGTVLASVTGASRVLEDVGHDRERLRVLRLEGREKVSREKSILEREKNWQKVTEAWQGKLQRHDKGCLGELPKFDVTGDGVCSLGCGGFGGCGWTCNPTRNGRCAMLKSLHSNLELLRIPEEF